MARMPTAKPTNSDEREPQMLRARTSCPFAVVPSQCSGEGGWEPIPVMRLGSPGEMTGAKIAMSAKRMRITIPATDLEFPTRPRRSPPPPPRLRGGGGAAWGWPSAPGAVPRSSSAIAWGFCASDITRSVQLTRTRGSSRTYTMSTRKLAISTNVVIVRKSPCIRG